MRLLQVVLIALSMLVSSAYSQSVSTMPQQSGWPYTEGSAGGGRFSALRLRI